LSEDFQIEDEAEKLAESPSEIILQYLSEHGAISKEVFISLLIEKCDLSRDEAEKVFEDFIEKGKIKYSKAKHGYVWAYPYDRVRIPRFSNPKLPPAPKSRARLDTVLKLPPDPHMLPVQSHFLARDNPSQIYYHPAMDQDKLAYLRAKEKMGAGADWPA
jgi:hypothetical protein